MKIVYLTKKNSDTVEGRGPMIVDCGFTNRKDAEDYIDPKPGIMGRTSEKGWSKEKYGDWEIEELMVFENLSEKTQYDDGHVKRAALAKLTIGLCKFARMEYN